MNYELRIKKDKKILVSPQFPPRDCGENAAVAESSRPASPKRERGERETLPRPKKLLNCFIVILFFGFLVFWFFINFNNNVLAQTSLIEGEDCKDVPCTGSPGDDQYCCGNYQLNDFIKIAINIAAWILGITGSLALLFFIYGGFMFLISAGSSERVGKAKQIIIGAVVGVVIVLTSFLIINFVLTSLGADQFDGKPWYKLK